jgi:membrane carboxypeptidase/penicillin-binding protein
MVYSVLAAIRVAQRYLSSDRRSSGLRCEDFLMAQVSVIAYKERQIEVARAELDIGSSHLSMIQEGLRGVVRLPEGTAHSFDSRDFPIPVMVKTGTTSDFRDALFVGSTYGRQGITVAVRIGSTTIAR